MPVVYTIGACFQNSTSFIISRLVGGVTRINRVIFWMMPEMFGCVQIENVITIIHIFIVTLCYFWSTLHDGLSALSSKLC
jgi:hypothetical protein